MPRRPNVIMLITHDTGQHISPYGVEAADTPNCERLAAESTLFSNSFCTAPQCSPSRAAAVTGRYPHANGVMGLTHADFAWAMHEEEKPIGKIFGPAGYQTWLLAGQHEAPDPHTLGFDVVDANHHLLDVPQHFEPLLNERDESKPFYCQLGGFETHRGWEVFDTPPDERKGVWVPPYLNDGPETRKELAQFQGMVKRFDTGLGMLLDFLEKHDLAENTILVITTDHGIAMPHAKATLYDPGIETMLFVRWPGGGWGQGVVRQELISNVDILPTLLEACGIERPDNLHGRSFAPLLAGEAYEPNEHVFAEKTFHGRYDPQRCVRTERYKYIRYFEKSSLFEVPSDIYHHGADLELGRRYANPRPPEELFDVQADPHETRNLAGSAEHAENLKQMRDTLATVMRRTDDPLIAGPIASPFYRRAIANLFGEA